MLKQLSRHRVLQLQAYIEQHYTEIEFQKCMLLEEDTCPADRTEARRSAPSAAYARPRSLEEMLRLEDAGFTQTLLRLIDEKGEKDSAIYKKANISKQHFSKIRNNPDYKPTKATAIAFAIALELNMEQTQDLIGRAGYALTSSSKFDMIIMYFIQNRNYNMFDINEMLYAFDQSLLGC